MSESIEQATVLPYREGQKVYVEATVRGVSPDGKRACILVHGIGKQVLDASLIHAAEQPLPVPRGCVTDEQIRAQVIARRPNQTEASAVPYGFGFVDGALWASSIAREEIERLQESFEMLADQHRMLLEKYEGAR